MKGKARIRHELFAKSSYDFQQAVLRLLMDVTGAAFEARRMGLLDSKGLDGFVIIGDVNPLIGTAVQCKGFEELNYGPNQHRQCRAEIAKYASKGVNVARYWLVLNRSIADRSLRDELLADLAGLTRDGKAREAELLDLEHFLHKLEAVAGSQLDAWAKERREELFAYYNQRLGFVRYIRNVPFSGDIKMKDPAGHVLLQIREFLGNVPKHQTGRYRPAPKVLITSEFGFGKTSTLHEIASDWLQSGGHMIYVPAALLGTAAFSNTSGLASALLELLIPEDADVSPLGRLLFRDAVRYLLATSKDWILLVDALDENAAAFRHDGLSTLWGSIRDLGVPCVLSARDEVVQIRDTEFFPDVALKAAPHFKRLALLDWDELLIAEFLKRFAERKGGTPCSAYRSFVEAVTDGRYEEVYGDIPKRPLFLGMLAEDAWAGNVSTRELHRLYGKYFRRKLQLDRAGVGAGGSSGRLSDFVDQWGMSEASERLMSLMQGVASAMLRLPEDNTEHLVIEDSIGEIALRAVATERTCEFNQIEDILMHSLLQPAGRLAWRERSFRFAHRSFRDWFLAREFAGRGRPKERTLPGGILKFLLPMETDLARGLELP